MKRSLLLTLSAFLGMAFVKGELGNLLPPQGDPIDLDEILVPPPPGPKSGVASILAWYDQETSMISLCMNEQQGPMVVTITDESGQLVFQQTVDGNQLEVDIHLPTLQSGTHSITIYSKMHLLAGKFMFY